MSLRWRITLLALLIAVPPVFVLGYLFYADTIKQAQTEYQQSLSRSAESAERRVIDRRDRERRAVERLCTDDYVVDRLLLDMQAGRFGPAEQADLVERVPPLMRSMGLVALLVIDARRGERYGTVIAAGHFEGRAGAREIELARAVEEAGDRWFVRQIPVRTDGHTRELSALLTGCVVERGDARVIAVGGQVLDEEFVRSLAAEMPPVQLVLTGADGVLPANVPAGGGRRDVYMFTDLAGQPAARLVAAVDDRPLAQRQQQITQRLLLTLTIALGAVLIFAVFFPMSITRPLRQLEEAATRVGTGDMSTLVNVPRTGGEVSKALNAFNRMQSELKQTQGRLIRAERIAAWRDIARRIAHEIKNPLMPIQTSIETMRKTHARKHPDFDEIFDESTMTILEEVERLKRIVTEFSRFARMPRPRPSELAPAEVVQHVIGLHQGGAVEVTMEVQGQPPRVRADREQLTQVLVNLVQNAADAARSRFGDQGGRVHVVVAEIDEGVRVEVIDNGIGIPEAERARIFEPYYTTKAGGTGLGLSIVHRIVSDHGGRIDVDEADGGGAVFEIVLTKAGPPVEVDASQTDTDLP
jgi:two-component system nitrogen regulation sensor histidine kinase NtrY